MERIVECVPNFSEGRDAGVVDALVAALTSVAGVYLLDREMDAAHHRSVITVVGAPEVIGEAAVRGVACAAARIDLTRHRGEHPRMGAADVVPFVPIQGVTMGECVALAEEVGRRIADELGIPVFLYEAAARTPERQNLAAIRQGEFEGIREAIRTDPARRPDFGPAEVHPTAGVTAVGAREPLIAYNIYLRTDDVAIAQNVAKAVRAAGGGLAFVKALGFQIKERGQVQVSMNLVNYRQTPIVRAFEMVKREAERYGVSVASSEIVGLVPHDALDMCAAYALRLERFTPDQVLENRLRAVMGKVEQERILGDFLHDLASSRPTPGGGSVAALAATLAAALGRMVCGVTTEKKTHASVRGRVREIAGRLEKSQQRLFALIDEDAQAFEAVLAARRLPQGTDRECAARERAIAAAMERATETPLTTAETAVQALQDLAALVPLGAPRAISDLGVAALMAQAAARGAAYNVLTNVAGSDTAYARAATERLAVLTARADALAREIDGAVRAAIGGV